MAASFSALAARRLGGPLLTPANALTLSRAGAAALLCRSALDGRGRRLAWLALLLGCTAADWLDGPLARRRGPSRLGARLDIEADSWLTLWAAVAAYRGGRLPGWVLAAPGLRYLNAALPERPPAPWQRAAGAAQMVALCAALAPAGPLQALGRALGPPAAALQCTALLARRLRARKAGRVDGAHDLDRLPLADHRGGAQVLAGD